MTKPKHIIKMAPNRHATSFINHSMFTCVLISLWVPIAPESAPRTFADHRSVPNDDGGRRLTREYDLRQGALRGLIVKPNRHYDLQNVEMFLGIPYAAPPVGNFRFMPPVSAPSWPGVKMATRFAPVCPQALPAKKKDDPQSLGRQRYMERLEPFLAHESEDCLYLNIYVPYRVRDVEAVAPVRPVTVAAIALSIKSRAIQDSRCYLMNGGAVESFFISEDTPVGSVIGTLSVNGDPSDDGNISLKLQEKNAALGIAPGTKNLTLLRALDREERQGPSNVYVNVRCDRRRTTDPSFIIPVSVRVWDVNDNAPMWAESPYRVRLSELTAAGSRVLPALRATDADQAGPHATLHYSVLPGPNSEYFGFANELDSVLVVKQPLDYETLSNFTVSLRAQDQGHPPLHNDTTLFVEVLDADDQNPKFSHDHYTALLPDDAIEGLILDTKPGPVSAVDQDVGINAPLYYSATGDKREAVSVDRETGRVAATKQLLQANAPVTVVIRATQVDNPDRYALATLSISKRSGALSRRGVRFARRAFAARVPEHAPPGTVLLTLGTEPLAPRDAPLQFYVSDRSFLDKFAINSAGEVLLRRALDYETTPEYHYQVMVTDGIDNDTASINISVLNVNEWEPRFKYPQYEFRVEEGAGAGSDESGAGLLPVGRLDVFDGDAGDNISLTLRGSDASMFYINDAGEMFMRQNALSALNSSVLHVVATAVDSGSPPRQTSVPVIVHVSARLLSAREARAGGALVFAGALALAALVVLSLLALALAYMYRSRRSKEPAGAAPAPEKPALGASSGSLLSVSAGASTILANSTSSLDLRDVHSAPQRNATVGRHSQRHPSGKVAPAPAPPGALSDHLQRAAGRSGVAWPSATIPARVKKLSWDDGDQGQGNGEGEVNEATNPAVAEHMNLTVYF